jgi:hypothetical protein
MRIETDIKKLGDKGILSAEENLRRMYEETETRVRQYRTRDHELLKNERLRRGRMMHSSEFITRVRKLNPSIEIIYSRNWKNGIGFYIRDKQGRKYLGAIDEGWVPEFTVIQVDTADLQKSFNPAWRTVLIRLLRAGVLRWEQVIPEFGDPEGVASQRWRLETQEFRSR